MSIGADQQIHGTPSHDPPSILELACAAQKGARKIKYYPKVFVLLKEDTTMEGVEYLETLASLSLQ